MTNFALPLSLGEETGISTTRTISYVPCVRVVALAYNDTVKTISIPAKTVITRQSWVTTSAFAGGDSVSAMSVNLLNGTALMNTLSPSINTRTVIGSQVSAAVYDVSGTIVVSLSAPSTTVFTGGGGRAMIEYITVD